MALSKTQNALKFFHDGVPVKEAAKRAGVAESTLRMAIGRARGRDKCPCCNQVVRSGFDVDRIYFAAPELLVIALRLVNDGLSTGLVRDARNAIAKATGE